MTKSNQRAVVVAATARALGYKVEYAMGTGRDRHWFVRSPFDDILLPLGIGVYDGQVTENPPKGLLSCFEVIQNLKYRYGIDL